MTAPSPVVAEPAVRTPAQQRRRFWARLIAFVIGGLFVLPTVLQTEPQPQRADAAQVAEGGGAGGAGGHRGSAPRGARGRNAAPVSRPFYRGMRDAPLGELETLSNMRARGVDQPRETSLETENPQIEDFSAPAAAISASGPFALPNNSTDPVGGTGGVAPPITTNPTPPPVVVPPVVTPPVVTPPVVTPPVVTPPVVTPPVVTPPVVIPPEPPTTDPGFPSGPVGGGPTGAVPEPATWVQLILGAGMVGAVVRRRRRGQPLTALRARSSALAAVSRLG